MGINNIVSHKVCSYSCVYCQIGNTVHKSITRRNFYEPGKLVEDVERHLKKLDKNHTPDYLTFVANGESTLDINIGMEIKLLKKFGIPIAVITNSSLINCRDVQEDLMEADWVSVKVNVIDENTWVKINRPLKGVKLENILEGLMISLNDARKTASMFANPDLNVPILGVIENMSCSLLKNIPMKFIISLAREAGCCNN